MGYGKIIFGIVIPVLIIIFLAVLGGLNLGIAVDYNLNTELSADDIYSNGRINNHIILGNVQVSNEFFLPARYEFENNIVCLIDDENVMPPIMAGPLSYQDTQKDYSNNNYPSYSYSSYPLSSLEVVGAEKKEVNVILSPSYVFSSKTGEQLTADYRDYDRIVLARFASKKNYYVENPCTSVDKDKFEKARSIKLNLA